MTMKKALQSLILLLAALLPQTASADNVKLGDVNSDSYVDINDVTDLIGFVLGIPGDPIDTVAADVFEDGMVDINDVTTLISIVLGAIDPNPPGTVTFTVNGVTFTMVTVEGGTFTMGATAEQGSDAGSEEYPTHQVTLSSYSIGQTEVTQELWQAVMGSNPAILVTPRATCNIPWNKSLGKIVRRSSLN